MSSGGPARPSPSQDLDRQGKQWANAMWMLGKWPKRGNMRAGPSDHQMGPCGAGGGLLSKWPPAPPGGHQPHAFPESLGTKQGVAKQLCEAQSPPCSLQPSSAPTGRAWSPSGLHGGDGGGGWATGIGLKVKCEQAPQRRGALKAP